LLSVTAHFDWSMAPRFGSRGSHGELQIHNDPDSVQNLVPGTHQRQGYTVDLDAGHSHADGTITSYSWVVRGPGSAQGPGAVVSRTTLPGPHLGLSLIEGTYSVALTVTAGGQSSTEFQTVRVRDILIVAVGDSEISGESDPDVPGQNGRGTVWSDSPGAAAADRSGRSASAQAALQIENADPHTSVTFVSVAVSGAKILPGSDGPGLIGPGGQLDQVKQIVGNRPIDALLIDGGSNDAGFHDFAKRLVSAAAGFDNLPSIQDDVSHGRTKKPSWDHLAFDQLPAAYDALSSALQTRLPNAGPNVFFTEYHDPTRDSHGQFVDGGLGDIFPYIPLILNIELDANAAAFAYNQFVRPLNQAVADAVARHGWHLVGGIESAFRTHGYTAAPADRWVTTATESQQIEGPVGSSVNDPDIPGWVRTLINTIGQPLAGIADKINTKGTAHPNDRGQQAIAGLMLTALQPTLQWSAPDPVRPYTVSVAGSVVTITPTQHRTTADIITLTSATDLPADLQVFVNGQLIYEAPAASLSQVTITGGDGGDQFFVRGVPAGPSVGLNGGAGADTFTIDGIDSPLTVSAGNGGATVNLERATALTTVRGGTGTNTFNVAPTSHNLDNLRHLTLDGGSGMTTVVINDQANPWQPLRGIPTTYRFDQNGATYGLLRSSTDQAQPNGPTHGVTIDLTRVGQLQVSVGPFTNTIDVNGCPAGTSIASDRGSSTVNLSPTAHNLDGIGNLSLSGGTGRLSLVVNDQANTTPLFNLSHSSTAYTLSPSTLIRDTTDWIRRDTLPVPDPVHRIVHVSWFGLTDLTLNADSLSNSIQVTGTGCPTTVNAGPRGDTIVVGGPEHGLDQVGLLTVNANGGSLTLDDRGAGQTVSQLAVTHDLAFAVSDRTVSRTDNWQVYYDDGSTDPNDELRHGNHQPPPRPPHRRNPGSGDGASGVSHASINYTGASRLEIDGAAFGSSFAVQSTAAGTPVSVLAPHGGLFTAGDHGSVRSIRSAVTLAGSHSSLVVDDGRSTSQDRVTLTATQMSSAGAAPLFGTGGSLAYSGLDQLTLNLSSANDDTVRLTPSADTAFVVIGNSAAFQAGHGAALSLDLTGVTNPVNTPAGPGSGQWTFGNRRPVTYGLGMPLHDVTAQMVITRANLVYNRTTGLYTQQVTIRNTGTTAVVGPLSLVLDHLTSNVVLDNQSGVTRTWDAGGNPYLNVALPNNQLAAGQSVTVELDFDTLGSNPGSAGINYDLSVVAGTGER
jgi:hypothetical protein